MAEVTKDFPANKTLFDMVRRVPYITLGTGHGCVARVTPLFFSLHKDEAGALCAVWRSSAGAAHSKQLVHVPSVSGVIIDTTQLPGTGIGLYIDGSARVVRDMDEIKAVLACLKARSDHANDEISDYTGPQPRLSLYRMTIQKAWTNGAVIHPDGTWDNATQSIPVDALNDLYPLPPLPSCRPAVA